MLYLQSVATTIWVGPTGILPLWIGSTTTPYVNHISFWSNTVRVYSLLQLKLLKYFHVHGPQLFDRPDTMALHWPVLTATQVWTNNGNGDTSTGSVRDPQRHQWIKADWLHMTPFCCFSFFVVFYCSFMILCVSIYNHLIYIYICTYLYIWLCSFCFCSFALVKQYCRIKKSARVPDFERIHWRLYRSFGQFISDLRWFRNLGHLSDYRPREDEAKVFGAFWCRPYRHSLADIKHWECKTIREQRHEKRNGKNAVQTIHTHRSPQHAAASHDTLNQHHVVHRSRQMNIY